MNKDAHWSPEPYQQIQTKMRPKNSSFSLAPHTKSDMYSMTMFLDSKKPNGIEIFRLL